MACVIAKAGQAPKGKAMDINENTVMVGPDKISQALKGRATEAERNTMTNEKSTDPKNEENIDVITAMKASVRYVLIALGILAGVAAFFALGILLDKIVPPVWYGWARIITRDYTDVVPALWVNWLSLLAAGWAFGVAYKLGNARFEASVRFAALMLVIVIFGAIPATCALLAATSGAPFGSGTPMLHKAAMLSAVCTLGAIVYGIVAGGLACVGILSEGKK